MLLIKHHTYYWRCKTKYRWHFVDSLLTLIFRMWLGAWVSVFCTSRRLIRWKWTVTYQCQYFRISSSISEYNYKRETRNQEPEVGPDGCSQTRRNPWVDRYRSRFGPPGVSGWGFWPGLESNRPVFAVQTRIAGGLPGPVANTTDESNLTITRIFNQYNTLKLLHALNFYYSKFSPTEQNYTTCDHELVAIVERMKQWKLSLKGAMYKVLMQCDCKIQSTSKPPNCSPEDKPGGWKSYYLRSLWLNNCMVQRIAQINHQEDSTTGSALRDQPLDFWQPWELPPWNTMINSLLKLQQPSLSMCSLRMWKIASQVL